METYNFNFITPYVICSNFRERDIQYLNLFISQSRLGEKIKLSGIGNISFNEDDKYHFNPICEKYENYTKGKINCLIFDIKECEEYKEYNKIFVYQVTSKNNDTPLYGYILYNNDGTNVHVPMLSSNIDELNIKINSSLTNLKRYRILNEISRQSESISKNINILN